MAVCGGQLTTLGVCGIASRSRSASLIAPARTQAERVTFQCLSEGGSPALVRVRVRVRARVSVRVSGLWEGEVCQCQGWGWGWGWGWG